jgi:surface antigen
MTTIAQIINRARKELGYRESGDNHTKYGAWYGMNGQPWCAMFVSWVFYHEGMPLPFTTGKGFAYTPSGAAGFKNRRQWHASSPKPGDVVFFNFGGGRINHVGIVESVHGDGSITTLEGNTSDSVKRMRRRSSIAGYGRPNFSGGGGHPAEDWFFGLSRDDLKNAVREILNEGTAYGQKNWAGTSRSTLGTTQALVNIIRGDLITQKLPVSTQEIKKLLDVRSQFLTPENQE